MCDTCIAARADACETEYHEVADAEKFTRLEAMKRDICTPAQSPIAQPALAKARMEEPLPAVPKFPPVLPTPAPSSDAVLTAIAALTKKVQGMRLEAATKTDLVELREGIRQETRTLIIEAVSPLKSEISSLQQGMQEI